MRWRDKFKRVYDINADATAKRLHDRLHEVSETYRNTYGHGGFDKEGGAIYFHVPEVGALPARLTDVRDSPHCQRGRPGGGLWRQEPIGCEAQHDLVSRARNS
jgi:hypothetical protein